MLEAVLVELGGGDAGRPIFLFPGAGGEAQELAALAAALPQVRPILGVEPFERDRDGLRPSTVEAMAEQAVAAIRRRQPEGPYDLIGYSCGALIVVEAARRLRDAGQPLGLTGFVDAVFDRRYWPTAVFVKSQLKRSATHIAALARRPLGEAAPEFVERAGRLFRRFAHRAGAPVEVAEPAELSLEAHCLRAIQAYRPSAFPGPVDLFCSGGDGDFGCDPADLWRPLIADLRVWSVEGGHLGVVREPGPVAELAAGLTNALERKA